MLWPVVGSVPVVVSTIDSESTRFPFVVQILVVVQVPVEWCQLMSILHAAILPVALVVGVRMVVAMAAFLPLVGFPIFESEITSTTNEQKSTS